MLRLRYNPPVDVFPTDPWSFEATRFDAKLADRLACHSETLFALSNGYLGMRGTYEEGAPACEPGVFLNGFYEHRPISYGERAHGFPRLGQSILSCPDGTILRLFVDDEPLLLTQAEILSFRRTLDFRDGTLRRDVRWVTTSGKHMRLATTRLVSLRHRHLAAIAYQLTAEDADADVTISSELLHRQPLPVDSSDPRLAEGFVGRVLHPTGTHCDGLRTVLAMFLLSNHFTPENRKHNFDYYDPLTTHDSSLSVCVQSIVANEIGYRRKAMRYFNFAAVMDVSDVGGNVMHGAHVASIGGTWLALVYGFAGMRDHEGRISFRPRLPDAWTRLAFPLMIRGQRLQVDIQHQATTYTLIEGTQLTIAHDGQELSLSTAAPMVTCPNPPPGPEPEPDFADDPTRRPQNENGTTVR